MLVVQIEDCDSEPEPSACEGESGAPKREPKLKKKSKKKSKRRDPGPIKPGQHLLLKEQVLELCGQASYSAVWSWMKNAGFPRPIALGPPEGRTTKIAWIAAEVFAWLAMRPRRDIGGLGEIREAQEEVPRRRKVARAAR